MRTSYLVAAIIGGIIASALLVKGCVWLVSSEYTSAKVTERTYTHTVYLRHRTVSSDGSWYWAPGSQGYYNEPTFNEHCFMREHGSHCISRDKNGYCRVYMPDFDRYCTYNYYSWPVIDTKSVSGKETAYEWPTFNPDLKDSRESRESRYAVKFMKSDGFIWIYDAEGQAEYESFIVGDTWKLKLPHVGSMRPVKKLTAERIDG